MEQEANIIVVDDDVVIRNLLDRYLTAAGYGVRTAANGEEMYRCVKLQPPDLILLDLKMPGKHGLELAKELRKDSDVGIIILTGSDETVDKVVGLEVGADDYDVKPIDFPRLLVKIERLLGNKEVP